MDTDVRWRRRALIVVCLLLVVPIGGRTAGVSRAPAVVAATPFVRVDPLPAAAQPAAKKKVAPKKAKAAKAKKAKKAKATKKAKKAKKAKSSAKKATKKTTTKTATASASKAYTYHAGYVTPQDLWHLYAEPYATDKTLPAPSASSPLVAVVESGSYAGGVYRDLTAFRKRFGLPACAQGSCFREIGQDGTSTLPGPDPTSWSSVRTAAGPQRTVVEPATSKLADDVWWTEADLDVEAVSATCPDCRILVADADPAQGDAGLAAAARAAVWSGAQYISMSFGWGGDNVPGAAALFATRGVVFTAAPGDNGYGGATLPAAYAGVLSVGGLTFTTSANAQQVSFKAWSDSGSGCSTSARSLLGQLLSTVAELTCGGAKASNDLSALADPSRGLETDLAGSWALGGGTSLSAPLVAGLYAAAGNHTDPTAIYANAARTPSLFRDVTSGSTGTCPVRLLCTAAAGWDAPTGLGTPVSLAALQPAAGG